MSQIGNVYGLALYSLAKEEELCDAILWELYVLDHSFQEEPQFFRLLSAPNISVAERCQIIDDCFRGKVHQYVLNFLKILTEKGTIKSFSSCFDAYVKEYNEERQILLVTAVTAVPLTFQQHAKLEATLSKVTGKNVQVISRVDPECVGGVRLDYDGKRIDGSVANRLESIRSMLKNTVL